MTHSDFVPTPAGIEAAKAALFADPALLARMMQYALNHLEDDAKAHPEVAGTIEAEGETIQAYRLAILAALREEDPTTLDLSDAWDANMWMLSVSSHDADVL